jgi:hypothetical protein
MIELPNQTVSEFASRVSVSRTGKTVAVYTRHKPGCPKNGEPYWRRCRCIKCLYIYSDGDSRQISAKTRSWEKAEEKAQELKAAFDLAKQLERELEAKMRTHDAPIEIAHAVDEFLEEVKQLNREEATRSKYALTLSRLATWCAIQKPPVLLFSQLDVPMLGVGSVPGMAPQLHATISISVSLLFSIFASNKAGSRRILPEK